MPSTFTATTRTQRTTWGRGEFHRIGVSLLIVGELLVRDLEVHAGERVLDVAGGAGNTALAAARRNARVTCTDYVLPGLAQAHRRAEVEGLDLALVAADAQALPFPDRSFDVVTSTFGAMFAPDQAATAAELLRVLRPGGRLGMANWTPHSWIAAKNQLCAGHAPPPTTPAPSTSPMRWGSRDGLTELFDDRLGEVRISDRYADFVQNSTTELFELFKNYSGGTSIVLDQLPPAAAEEFARAWIELADSHNGATDGTCAIRSPYLQVIAVKKR